MMTGFNFELEKYNHKLAEKRLAEQAGIIRYPGNIGDFSLKISGLLIGVAIFSRDGVMERLNVLNVMSGDVTREKKISNHFFGQNHLAEPRNSKSIIVTDDFPTYLATAKDFRSVYLEDKEDLITMMKTLKETDEKNTFRTRAVVVNLTKKVLDDDSKESKYIEKIGYSYLPKKEVLENEKTKDYIKGPKENPQHFIKIMLYITLLARSKIVPDASMSSLIEEADRISRSGENSLVKTGFGEFQLAMGEVGILGGAPGVGKTSLVLQAAENLSEQGYDVNFISFEMSAKNLVYKSISRNTVPCSDTIDTMKTHREISSIYDHIDYWSEKDKEVYEMAKLKTELSSSQVSIHSFDTYAKSGKTLDLSSLEKIAKERMKKGVKSVFFIDYLQIIARPEEYATVSEVKYIQSVMQTLKKIAAVYNVAILALSSLRKDALNKNTLDVFLGAGEIGYTADYALVLSYDAPLNDKEAIIFIEAEKKKPFRRLRINRPKNRYGSAEPIKLINFAPCSIFYSTKTEAEKYGLYFPTNENEYNTLYDYRNDIKATAKTKENKKEDKEELPF